MSYNIFFRNTDYDAIAKEIEVQSPDILLLAEVEGDAYEEIAKRLGDYKYSGYQGGRVPYFDLAYFSRLPLTETVHYLSSFQIPTYELELSVGSKTLRLIGVHTSAPVSALYSQSRDEHLRAVAKIVNASTTPTLVIGDLNITPWSPIFKEFIDESGLAEARLGRGLLPSWNSAFAGPMRIPIDHILTKGAVEVRQIWTGSSSGSDHLPIIADLSI
jgi:endonuclease/exonuclease/phosphatase (EEP) superfamily protein YafD